MSIKSMKAFIFHKKPHARVSLRVCKHILPFIMANGIIRQWTPLQEVHLYRSDLEAPSRQCDQLRLSHLAQIL